MENFRDKENILDTDKDESIDDKDKKKRKKKTKRLNSKAVLYDSEGNIIPDIENEENTFDSDSIENNKIILV